MANFRIPTPDIDFNPPVYYCKRATKKFELDGNLDKPFWEDADFTDYFVDIEGDKRETPRFKTRAKMLWDDENLYFGAVLEGDEIWGILEERDCVIFQDNDFEIFIDPDSDTHQYYEFEMNAKNTVWDLLLTKPYRDFGGKPVNGYDIHGMQTAVYIDGELNNPNADNKKWSVEVVMPFTALKETAKESRNPKVGEYYRLNFSRVHWRVDKDNGEYKKQINPETNSPYPEDNWVWAPTGLINIHYPELWGFLFFTENGERYDIPNDELLKWELRKLYYKQHALYDTKGYFTTDLEELLNGEKIDIEPIIEVTKHTFEMRVLSQDKKREISIQADGRTEIYDL